MTYRITSDLTLADEESGNLVRTTEGWVFRARDEQHAREAVQYLKQPRGPTKRRGSHEMKSTFGT